MRHTLLTALLFLAMAAKAAAQSDDEKMYRNFGLNIGWNYSQPTYKPLDAYAARFNSEPAFAHTTLEIASNASGGSFGFTYFGGHSMMDFEYRAQGITATYGMKHSPTEDMKDYTCKFFFHSGRYSYSWGFPFGKYGTTGIYLGAAIYGGTWDAKLKGGGFSKYSRQTGDDFKGFSAGISPQLTFRTYILEVKAYYDVPFVNTNLAPLYNYYFKDAGAADASGDATLKGKLSNLGVCATIFIPFGRPRASNYNPQYINGGASGATDDKSFQQARERENQQSRDRIDKANSDWEKQQNRSNERQHERERTGH